MALLLAVLIGGCSTTKNIPDDDQLYVGLRPLNYLDADDSNYTIATQEEVEAALATAPNDAFFGSSYFRSPLHIGLGVWNAFSKKTSGFAKWMTRTFGSEPVLMSNVNPALRSSVAKTVLRNNGYMHSQVDYRIDTLSNPKKAKIAYSIRMDSLLRIDSMSYVGFPAPMKQLIDSTASEAIIGRGSPFSASLLDSERARLTTLFRNNGYFFYNSGYASYLADTFDVKNRAQLRLQMVKDVPEEAVRPWYIRRTRMNLKRSFREALTDSTVRRSLSIFYSGKRSPIRPRVVLRNMSLMPRQPYSYAKHVESLARINSTGVFSSVDFQFTPVGNDSLDLTIDCTFDKPYDFYLETTFKNRTIGRYGPELRIGFTKLNAFRGGEKLDVNLHGNYEWQAKGQSSNMNSWQYGADISIEFPRIIAPFVDRWLARHNRRRQFFTTPTTMVKASMDIIHRPGYYRMHVAQGEWTYKWQSSANKRHEFSPLTLKYQRMNNSTHEFDSILIENPYLMVTMSDVLIPKMRYTYVYQSPSTRLNPLRWEITVQEAGNLTALFDLVVQKNKWNQRGKTLFKNEYSQFVKVETDLTKTWQLGTSDRKLVGHINAGVVYAYGNSVGAPFSESFYVGGANSVRAFTARSIGPGGYTDTYGLGKYNYLLRNGELKFVGNLEYRQRLFGNLHGAIFLDAGNVWSINNTNSEMGFRMNKVLKNLATGTGLGLRYDMEFLVIRVDWGFALHAPYDTGKSGYFNLRRFKDMHSLHLAVGYPF